MAISGALLEVASYADVKGLDWDELNYGGNGILDSDEYIFQLNDTYQRFLRVINTLSISEAEWMATTPDQAMEAWEETSGALSDKADAILDAIADFELSLAWDNAVTIYSGYLRNVILAAGVVATAALESHEGGVVRFAIETGQLSLAGAEEDADNINKLYMAVVKLDEYGLLNDLKKPQYMSGVGAAAAVLRGAPLAWAIVGGLAVLAAAVVVVWSISEKNSERRVWCLDDDGNIREDAPDWCYEEPADPMAMFLAPLTAVGSAIGTAIGIAVGVGALIWFGTKILPKLVKKRAAA